ncbi:MAG: NAD(+)/NADH kinase, partial [Acidobacteria bacterium]|nr:NAD(+)/NADH kinase [Acidobacteriota bacterium]
MRLRVLQHVPFEGPANIARWAEGRGIVLNVACEIAPALAGSGLPFHVYEPGSENGSLFDPLAGNLLVSLGGDGTLIRAVRRFWPLRALVLSVNLGSLGFNASVEPERVTEALATWERGAAPISERMTVRVRLLREGATVVETMAINDVVLLKEHDARMIHFSLRQGGAVLTSFA